MQELLPRMRTHGEAEHGSVLAALQLVGARLLQIGPSDRQLGGLTDFVVHDRAVTDRRTDHLVALGGEHLDQFVQSAALDYNRATDAKPFALHSTQSTRSRARGEPVNSILRAAVCRPGRLM